MFKNNICYLPKMVGRTHQCRTTTPYAASSVVSVIAQAFTLWASPDVVSEYAPNLAALVIIEVFLVYLLVIFVGILRGLVKKLRRIKKGK